jgi:RNA polymerase sigma factor (sigma-70 family)
LSLNDLDASVSRTRRSLTTHEANPERQTNLNELQIKLNEAMQKLSEPHRMVVTMFDIQGMSHADIAKVLKTSEGTDSITAPLRAPSPPVDTSGNLDERY